MNTKKPTSPSPIQAYKYCPKCSGKFDHKGGNLLKCEQCSFNFFVNAAPAAGILIINDKNEVLLAKRKFDPKKGTWQTPGGFMHPEETFEEALHREVEEELGVKIKLGDYAGTIPELYDYCGVLLPFLGIYCTATIISGKIKSKDDVEEARFFSLEEIEDLDIAYPALRPLIRNILVSR